MTGAVIKIVSLSLTAVGIAVEAASTFLGNKKTDMMITEKVNKAVAIALEQKGL